ncbi:MAG: excinuclease ABC subunit UvrC, partial [Fusobacteriaceae bacterium]
MIPRMTDIPELPGVYLMKKNENVIYVGKAKNLKNRVSSYFNREHEEIKTKELVKNIESIEFIICSSELDALVLENNLIKKYLPKYNIALKDQKTYPYLKLTKEKFPTLKIIRNTKELEKKDGIFFGPYVQGCYAIKKALNRVFKLRDCNRDMNKFYPTPCLKYYMHFCSAPCHFKEISSEYSEQVEMVKEILSGKGTEYISKMKSEMELCAQNMEFESAIFIREQIKELGKSVINQIAESNKNNDEDYFSFKILGTRLFITVLTLREGKILGKNSLNISLENKIYEDTNETVVTTYYSKNIPPKEIIFDEEMAEKNIILRHWFKKVFAREVDLTFPRIKSRKKEILEMAKLNLEEEIKNYYRKKLVLEKGLMNIYKSLSLMNYPKRIECFDISNISGKDAVASMSVSIDGITKPKEYRKFKISSKDTPDDFAMMKEVIKRRYSKLAKEEFPDMILIDGGLGQINAVAETLKELDKIGISDLLSLAKKEEEIYKFGISQPYIFSKSEESIKIFQRVRDEAH